jgi:hypothetical protein
MLAIGALPALLVLAVRSSRIKESELWTQARQEGHTGSFWELFSPALRRRTLAGLAVTAAMLVVWWGDSAMIPGLVKGLIPKDTQPAEAARQISLVFVYIMLGSLPGYLLLGYLSRIANRKLLYFGICICAMLASFYMFLGTNSLDGVKSFAFIFGFFVVAGFGFFGIYLPELFPTHVRATGLGFTYNAGRFITAMGVLVQGLIVYTFGSPAYAGAAMASAGIIGAVAIWFGPETRMRES